MPIDTRIGVMSSTTPAAVHDDWLPTASRTPDALAANAIVNPEVDVFGAPAPSVNVNVTVDPDRATEASVPPEGTPASVHGAVVVVASNGSENTNVTVST